MSTKQEAPTADADRGARYEAFKKALLWLTAILVAIFPFPWWS